MAITSADLVQQPSQRYLPTLTGAPRVWGGYDDAETTRPVVPADGSSQGNALSSELASTIIPFSPDYRRRASGATGGATYRSPAGPDDPPRMVYNPRGAPSDAVPALSKLEARIALEPVFMQHYASTLYNLVSRIPTTLAERRQAYDLLA